MKRLIVISGVLLILGATSAFAQGFQVITYYVSTNGAPLTTTCGGATGLPGPVIAHRFAVSDLNRPDGRFCLAPQ